MVRLIALIPFAVLGVLAFGPQPAAAQLRGHGGPARAVATSHDGVFAVSAGLDGSAIVWGLKSGQAVQVARGHDAPATATAVSRDIGFASGDQNGRVAVWRLGGEPRLIEAHAAPVVGLVASGDGRGFLSAGLDGSVTRIDADTGVAATLARRSPPLAAICAEGADTVVADREGGVRWLDADGVTLRKVAVGAPILAMACDERLIFVGTANGRLARVDKQGGPFDLLTLSGPISAVAARDGHVAAATAAGDIRIFDHGRPRDVVAKRGEAVWGLAFAGEELLAAGHDGFVRRYDVANGREAAPTAFAPEEALPAALRDHPGARVFEACRACHALTPGESRAGPSLAGVIGRRIATAPGYAYSQALTRLDLIWTGDNLARLFEIGPAAMTPGSKMPEQRVVDPAERAALADFLAQAVSQ